MNLRIQAGAFMKMRLRKLIQSSPPPPRPPTRLSPIQTYLAGGRIPHSEGYAPFRRQFVKETLQNPELMEHFRRAIPLPSEYGVRLDERVIEYPWVWAHLLEHPTHLLDAGGTLIFPELLDSPQLETKSIVVYTLAPETWVHIRPNVSYIYGDLREMILKDALFQEIVCISTLDHIGMDNTQIYSTDPRFQENSPDEYRRVLQECRRLLAPGGHLLLTVPFGRRENLGWMQQFDAELLQDVIHTFGGQVVTQAFYKYSSKGWQIATIQECANCSYFDVHTAKQEAEDGASAARAVACVELRA
jgi:hypothetical protein